MNARRRDCLYVSFDQALRAQRLQVRDNMATDPTQMISIPRFEDLRARAMETIDAVLDMGDQHPSHLYQGML